MYTSKIIAEIINWHKVRFAVVQEFYSAQKHDNFFLLLFLWKGSPMRVNQLCELSLTHLTFPVCLSITIFVTVMEKLLLAFCACLSMSGQV